MREPGSSKSVMADEEEHDPYCFLDHFTDRYQADLKLIYHKYEHLEDGCIESEEILLSNCGSNDDEYDWLDELIDGNYDKEGNESADDSDEGWESDSSGHTNTRELSSLDGTLHQDLAKKGDNNVQNCETGKPMQFIQPLSSTLASNSTGISEMKVDPKLSPVESQANNDFGELKGLEKQYIAQPNCMPDQEAGCSFMPGILSDNILTSTKLESSPNALAPLARTSSEEEDIADPSPNGLASFARAVLSTRNKIRNVLMTVDLKGYSSTESGYDSLSTDATTSSSSVQSTLNESLCPPDKLLKEFSNRLTAETFSKGRNRPIYSHGALTRKGQSVPKTRMLMTPNAIESNKSRTVSLLTNRRTIKFNPSLPELRKGMRSTPLTSDKKSVYIPLSMSTKTVDPYGRLKESTSTKAVLKISPVQGHLPQLAPRNCMSRGPREANKLQIVQNSENVSKPVIRLQESGCPRVAMTRRRSVCLPVSNSEIRRHSTNLLSIMHRGKGPEALPGCILPGQDRFGNIPRNIPTVRDREDDHKHERRPDFHTNVKNLPGQDGRKFSIRLPGQNSGGGHLGKNSLGVSRKRNFDFALSCSNMKTSPKRTCRRFDDDGESSKNEEIKGNLRNNEWQRRHPVLEVFDDVEMTSGINTWNKEDQSRDSNSERNIAVKKERRQSQKLLMEGTRSPCPIIKASPHVNMKIPPKTTNEDTSNTKKASIGSCHKGTVEDRNHITSCGSLVRSNKEVVSSPIFRGHSPRQLMRQNSLEEFKKLSHATASGKAVEDSRARTDGACSRTHRLQTANIRDPSTERSRFPVQNSRPILDVDGQNYEITSRNSSTPRERSSSCPNSHERLSLRKDLSRASEKRSTGEIKSSGRKRDRELETQGLDREICFNKTFSIDKRPCISESYDSCSPGYRCTKFICLNCGNFPSAIQDLSQSSADSFIRD